MLAHLISLFFSSFLAATILPFSSEVHFSIVLDEKNIWPYIIAATLGNTLGGLTSFYLGWLAKWHWIQKFLKIKKEKIDKLQGTIHKYGAWMALFTWAPIIGDVLAVGLGIFRVKWGPTALFMLVGKFFRYWALAWIIF